MRRGKHSQWYSNQFLYLRLHHQTFHDVWTHAEAFDSWDEESGGENASWSRARGSSAASACIPTAGRARRSRLDCRAAGGPTPLVPPLDFSEPRSYAWLLSHVSPAYDRPWSATDAHLLAHHDEASTLGRVWGNAQKRWKTRGFVWATDDRCSRGHWAAAGWDTSSGHAGHFFLWGLLASRNRRAISFYELVCLCNACQCCAVTGSWQVWPWWVWFFGTLCQSEDACAGSSCGSSYSLFAWNIDAHKTERSGHVGCRAHCLTSKALLWRWECLRSGERCSPYSHFPWKVACACGVSWQRCSYSARFHWCVGGMESYWSPCAVLGRPRRCALVEYVRFFVVCLSGCFFWRAQLHKSHRCSTLSAWNFIKWHVCPWQDL